MSVCGQRRRLLFKGNLPYSFTYKIRNAFIDEVCPICFCKMSLYDKDEVVGFMKSNRRPTIQHNKPISKGGRNDLDNISVICHRCNVTIRDTETGKLNNDIVISVWSKLCQK